jgi:hypothetical protein
MTFSDMPWIGNSNTNPLGWRRRAIPYRPTPPSPPPSSSSVCQIHRYSHGRQSKFAKAFVERTPMTRTWENRGTAKSATSDSESIPELSPTKPIRFQSFPFCNSLSAACKTASVQDSPCQSPDGTRTVFSSGPVLSSKVGKGYRRDRPVVD